LFQLDFLGFGIDQPGLEFENDLVFLLLLFLSELRGLLEQQILVLVIDLLQLRLLVQELRL